MTRPEIIAALDELSINDLYAIRTAVLDEIEARSREAGPTGLTSEELACISASNLIGCVKLIRERTGLGLREAKDLMDRARGAVRR